MNYDIGKVMELKTIEYSSGGMDTGTGPKAGP